ncbi:DeoR/GlpR family DNA-binding transcription regulator [Gorillibacterium sp. CAU 1737]|uniref:DeoR/GlpR family DNA-binding transcription regulator n=1 Tax=Gorillibacterium sp. CAU 1737 TaxID=3140362 RepID=UPI0032605DCF
MFAEERQNRIIELVNRNGKAAVQEMSESLGVSLVTIRRDLERLEEQGLLYRTHGGALSLELGGRETAHERSFSEKEEAFADEKVRIAEAAAAMVKEGDSLLFTPGTTNMMLVNRLRGIEGLSIVTNATNIASSAADVKEWNVILTGGRIRPQSSALVGPLAEDSLDKLRADRLFLGIDGLDIKSGLTTPSLEEASVNRKMIALAKQVVVVTDHSKFGKTAFSRIADLSAVDVLITDSGIPDEYADYIRKETDIRLVLV